MYHTQLCQPRVYYFPSECCCIAGDSQKGSSILYAFIMGKVALSMWSVHIDLTPSPPTLWCIMRIKWMAPSTYAVQYVPSYIHTITDEDGQIFQTYMLNSQ